MDKKIYEKTRYTGIWRNKKNLNYVVDICHRGIRTSISTVDGTKSGAKIKDIKLAKRIQDDPTIIKKVSLSINNKDTVEQAFETYMYNAEFNRKLAPNTLAGKRYVFNQYMSHLKKKRIVNVTEDDILDIKIKIDKNCKKDSAKYSAFKTIKSFFNWLVDEKILSESPAKKICQFKKTKIVHTIWTPSQVGLFRKSVEKDFTSENILTQYKARMIHLIVDLDYAMSARIGEVRALQYKKIQFETCSILISATSGRNGEIVEKTKTDGSTDIIDIPQAVMNEIKEYIEWCEQNMEIKFTDDTPLFFSPENKNKAYSITVIHVLFKKYCSESEETLPEMPIYNLRHSGVALMQELGYEIYVIQNRVRHKNIETTIDTYGSISKQTKKKLVEDISRFL